MKLFNKCKLDERQLLLRGNIYYQGLGIISSLLIVNFYIKTFFNLNWVYGDWDYLLILFIGITFICIRLTFCDIYPLTSIRYKIFFFFTGIYGIGILLFIAYLLFSNQTSFIIDNQISSIGGMVLFCTMYTAIFIGYLIKLFYDKYKNDMEDE